MAAGLGFRRIGRGGGGRDRRLFRGPEAGPGVNPSHKWAETRTRGPFRDRPTPAVRARSRISRSWPATVLVWSLLQLWFASSSECACRAGNYGRILHFGSFRNEGEKRGDARIHEVWIRSSAHM